MKSALFVQANVAVNTKLTPHFKKFGQKRAISVCYDGKIFSSPTPSPTFPGPFFRCRFRYPKVPLEAVAPPPPIF